MPGRDVKYIQIVIEIRDLREIGWDGMDWIDLARDRDR
jgi:hypothetical protein